MALTPTLPRQAPQQGRQPRFNETARAIAGSLLIALVLGSLIAGNPFRALRLAYTDYSHTPAAGAAKADPVRAPATK